MSPAPLKPVTDPAPATDPLQDLRVIVTRPRHQADALGRAFEERGAKVVYFPTIEIQDPPSWEHLDLSIRKLAEGLYSWVIFTSSNGVERFFQRLGRAELDARAFGRTKVAAVGSTTEKVLDEHGIRADFVPESFTGEALAETMGRGLGRVLIPRAELAPREMLEILESAGFIPEEVVAYRTVVASRRATEARDIAAGGFDVVTFLSGSTATGFVGVFGPPTVLDLGPSDGSDSSDGSGRTVAAIGPKTAEVAADLGFRVDVVAPDHTAEGLIEALAAYLSRDEDEATSEDESASEDESVFEDEPTTEVEPASGPEDGTIGR
ncbi:MAG: uroporphyrinogen-III synthase [Actinomycetota bacterium]|nr:uroporphyrinogen-III synthase [Actinomycetota bacterium]